MKKIMFGLVMVMMLTMVGCGNATVDKDNGFTPNQPSDTPNKVETEVETVVGEMTVEEMMQYYDAEQYVGTPSVKEMMFLHCDNDVYGFVDNADIFSGMLYVEYDERLVVGDVYKCIVCDNDTPDITRDDIVVYVFMD